MAEPLGYKKQGTTIFAKVKQLVQRLQVIVTKHKTIWDIKTVIVAFDSLNNNFEMTITPLSHFCNKNLKEI